MKMKGKYERQFHVFSVVLYRLFSTLGYIFIVPLFHSLIQTSNSKNLTQILEKLRENNQKMETKRQQKV